METYFNKREVSLYLNFLENCPEIMKFLSYDTCYRLADNYLLALVFIYFRRAGLKCNDYTQTNFYAALLLAHEMVEENDEHTREIYIHALPRGMQDRALFAQMETLKLLMFQAMGFRGYVSKDCCNLVMSMGPHIFWDRKRNAIHGGTYKECAKAYSKEIYDLVLYNTTTLYLQAAPACIKYLHEICAGNRLTVATI